jgi:hypothetical protein
MAFAIGVVVALAVSVYATALRLDRDRALYPTVLIVVASYYVLFATMAGSVRAIVVESLIAALFVVIATLGFRRSLWMVVAGLAAHGIQDFFHGQLVDNPGTPVWWPAWCGAYDIVAAAYLSWRLARDPARRAAVA